MEFNNIEHIFFDLDHTLWDFDKNSNLAFNSVFKKNKIEVELEKFLAVYSPINLAYWKRYRENNVTQKDLRYGRLKDSFDSLRINVTDEQIHCLSVDYIDHLPRHNMLLEGALEILEYLMPKYKLHIITNGFREVQHKKLKNSKISQFFRTVTTSEDAGVKKPNRLIFDTALGKASASINNSLMIGDSLEADIIGARDIGMRTILYNYHREVCSPEFLQVMTMKELENYL